MILAGGRRADSPLSQEPVALTLNHYDPFGPRSGKLSSQPQLHSFAQRFALPVQHHRRLPLPQPLPYNPPPPRTVTYEAGFNRHRPRHVPIVISPTVINTVLKDLPPSPISLEATPRSSLALTVDLGKEEAPKAANSTHRPRHIPIVIPDFAQPRGFFPPSPSSSAGSTPRASQKGLHSCELLFTKMSRPPTSDSRASTLDPNTSAPSMNQMYGARFKPPNSSTYLADMNSSSESSLNQAVQDAQLNNTDTRLKPAKAGDLTQSSSDGSPAAGHTPPTANGTTNLSGLVCNVHKCTGREPHARVGATTTILGDKLYVFGGRILSRRRPQLTSDMYELDLIRRHWTKLETVGNTPAPRYFHTVCASGDTKMICYGGMSPAPTTSNQPQGNTSEESTDPMAEMIVMSDIHVYDAPTRTWTHVATKGTPPGRYAHCAAVIPSSAVFTSANAPLSAILHNPPSAIPNQGTLGVALDGTGGAEMIVVGGQDSNNKYIDAISVFNLRSLKWTDTQSLKMSCGAYRSVVTPLTSLQPSKVGKTSDQEDGVDGANGTSEKAESASSMLIYSNYNFLDVRLELQVRLPDGSLVEKPMVGPVSPPGLRFPNGEILDNHFIVSGTYLTSSKHEYALWALDLRTLTWSRIDAGGGIFSQGSWNRGILWSRRNTFVILGNRKRTLVEDYNHRRINFSNICMVELEAFGLYDNPRRAWPTSNYPSVSAPVLPQPTLLKTPSPGGRPLSSAAVELGLMAMGLRDLADMDLIAISGERVPVNSYLLSRRWGPFFVQLLRDSGSSTSLLPNDASSSSDGGTLRPGHLNLSQSVTSRNSSITITPSVRTVHSPAPSSLTAASNTSNPTTNTPVLDPPTPHNLAPSSRPRQLYLPHTFLTLRALVHYLYTSSLPPPTHELCTPQILCSLLQLARPYRVDGLLEATVERIHQVLDGRNAAAVFNAAAMAAGGGRGTGTAFGKEGEHDTDDLAAGLTVTHLQARNPPRNREDLSESEDDSRSDISSSAASTSASESEFANGGRAVRKVTVGTDEVWSGGVSCVVGLQKRGLRGLMEGRRMRERERGRAVGGLGTGAIGNGVAGVGLGIA